VSKSKRTTVAALKPETIGVRLDVHSCTEVLVCAGHPLTG
jgi:hypothetical protein